MSRGTAFLCIVAGICALAAGVLVIPAARAAEGEKLLFSSNRNERFKLYLLDIQTGAVEALPNIGIAESQGAWSPDAKKIAFVSRNPVMHDIYVMDADGTNRKQLTEDPAEDFLPSWSPDGKKIAFFSRRTGSSLVFVMNADGSEQTNLTRRDGSDTAPTWSPDGKKILFLSDRDGKGLRLHVMDPNGDNVELLPAKESPAGYAFPAWSPDGKQIAYSDRIGDAIEIFLCDAAGKNPRSLTTLGGINMFPAWSRDGKQIALQHWDAQGMPGSLWVVDVKDGVQSNLGHTGSFQVGRPAWKP